MKKLLFIYILFIFCISLYSFPFNIVSEQDELKVYNNLLRIDYSFEGSEDYAYIDKLGLKSDIWVIYFHSFTGNARELYRSYIYKDLWISKIRESGYGSMSINIFGDSFMAGNTSRACHYLIHYIKNKYNVKKFIFAGASMGAFCALRYGELYPQDVSCIIAISPNSDIKSMFSKNMEFVFGEAIIKAKKKIFSANEDINKLNLIDNIHKLTMPVYLVYSREDEFVSSYDMDELVKKLNRSNNFKYIKYDTGTHFQTFSKGFVDSWNNYLNL